MFWMLKPMLLSLCIGNRTFDLIPKMSTMKFAEGYFLLMCTPESCAVLSCLCYDEDDRHFWASKPWHQVSGIKMTLKFRALICRITMHKRNIMCVM